MNQKNGYINKTKENKYCLANQIKYRRSMNKLKINSKKITNVYYFHLTRLNK